MCLVFFYFQDCWVVGGRLGWLYFINSLQIKQWYNSFIICKILVYIFNIFIWQTLEIKWKKVCHTNVLHACHILQHISLGIFSGKWYFNDMLWTQEYDNNTLLLAAIRYKKTRSSYGKLKGKGVMFLIKTVHIQCKQSVLPRSLELRVDFQTHRWLYIWEDTKLELSPIP